MQRTYERLSVKPYCEVFDGVVLQFDLLRCAIDSMSLQKIKDFAKARARDSETRLRNNFQKIVEMGMFPEKDSTDLLDQLTKHHKKVHGKFGRSGAARFLPEFSRDRLNQSELLLLIAHFESFMKLVHRAFLEGGHRLVFSKDFRGRQNAEIPVSEVFGPNFLAEMFEKEIKWLDGQKISIRAAYFLEHFGAKFGNEKDLKRLEGLFKLRNEISHNVFVLPAQQVDDVKEQPIVSDTDIDDARRMLRSIPNDCVENGVKTYQSYFRS